ncbi:MAG: hypothetical protein U0804_06715 [Gemmataceae bacterium]
MRTRAALVVLLSAAVVAAQPDAGVDVSPSGGRFKVRFPGKPEERTLKAKTPLGELTVYSATFATPDGSVYVVSHVDYPATAAGPAEHPRLLDGARDGLKGKDGKLVSETAVAHGPDKVGGREVVVDKGKVQLRYRLLMRDTRLYQVGAVGAGGFVTGRAASDFLDSFELVK